MKKLPGRSAKSIRSKAIKVGLTKQYITKYSVNYQAEYKDYNWCFERFINRCMSTEEIAKESGYKKRVIQKWLYEKYHLDLDD